MNGWGSCISDGVMTISCAPILLGNIIYWLLVFAGIIALVFIILSGIKFLTSQGDPKQVEGARKTLTWSIAGLALVLLSFAVVNVVAQITGVDCIANFDFGFTNCK